MPADDQPLTATIRWRTSDRGRIAGLPDRTGQYRTWPVDKGPDPTKGEVGDIAVRKDGEGRLSSSTCWARTMRGWHRVNVLSMDTEIEEGDSQEIVDGAGNIAMSWSAPDRFVGVTIVVDRIDENPDPELFVPVGGNWPDWTINGHPKRSADHTEDVGWRCLACGAETHDAELFRELACDERPGATVDVV